MLRTALIGLPQVGKTTLFELMTTQRETPHAAHGRTEVAVGVARVPDDRLARLAELFRPRMPVAATVEFADLRAPGGVTTQGLVDVVPYRSADALLHVLRAFGDESIPHVAGSVDPSRDAQAMEDELILADLAVAEKRLDRVQHDLKVKARSPELEREREVLVTCRHALEAGTPLRELQFDDDDRRRLRGFQFLSAKPLLLVINLDENDIALASDAGRAAHHVGLERWLARTATRVVAICARTELEMAALDPEEADAFRSDLGLREAGVDRVIRATYGLLGYITFLTIGDRECRAWAIPRGTTAIGAAGEVHSDMARGFVRAEVVSFEHLMARGSIAACRQHGEVRLEGKDYVVQDGDIVTVRFAT